MALPTVQLRYSVNMLLNLRIKWIKQWKAPFAMMFQLSSGQNLTYIQGSRSRIRIQLCHLNCQVALRKFSFLNLNFFILIRDEKEPIMKNCWGDIPQVLKHRARLGAGNAREHSLHGLGVGAGGPVSPPLQTHLLGGACVCFTLRCILRVHSSTWPQETLGMYLLSKWVSIQTWGFLVSQTLCSLWNASLVGGH